MKDEKLIKEVALWRISRLFDLAELNTRLNDKELSVLAKRYIILAKKMNAHYKVKMPTGIKDRICKACSSVMIPGLNCKVRIASHGFIVYICACGAQKKVYLKKKKNQVLDKIH